ncbi:unnamed protein product, partial [Polarella glacialis]
VWVCCCVVDADSGATGGGGGRCSDGYSNCSCRGLLMGPLKDALHLQVWTHLQTVPQCRSPLAFLSSPSAGPSSVRDKWAELQSKGAAEGVSQSSVLKSVLGERADLFGLITSDKGDLVIELTEAAQIMDPADGLP